MTAITPEDPRDPHRIPLALAAWIGSALAVIAGGLLHLGVWNSDYRDLPKEVPGAWVVKDGFPINAAASVLLAIALVLTAFGMLTSARRFVIPLALALEAGSIAALVLSRSSSIFSWSEKGWDGDAKQILVVELVTVMLLIAAAVLPTLLRRRSGSLR